MRRIVVTIAAVAGVALPLGSSSPAQVPDVAVAAHRGGAGQWPQNSLLAFSHAIRIGVDEVEADTWLTADHVAVIYHDPTINPARCHGYVGSEIRRLTLAQVRTVRCEGQPIPTERQFLNLVKKSSRTVRVRLETKSYAGQSDVDARAWAQHVCADVRATGLAKRAIMQDFNWAGFAGYQRCAPGIQMSALITDPSPQDIARAASLHAYDVSYDYRYETAALNASITAAGMMPVVWGIDAVPVHAGNTAAIRLRARQAFRRAVRLGARVVITNNPSTVLAARARDHL